MRRRCTAALLHTALWVGIVGALVSCAKSSAPAKQADRAVAETYEVVVEEKEEEPAATEPLPGAPAAVAAKSPAAKELKRRLDHVGQGKGSGALVRGRAAKRVRAKAPSKTIAGAFGVQGADSPVVHDLEEGRRERKNRAEVARGPRAAPSARPLRLDEGALQAKAGEAGALRQQLAGRAAPADKAGKKDERQPVTLAESDDEDGDGVDLPAEVAEAPATFLPRMGYFENTYLGGNAAYRERLRRLSSDLAGADRAWLKARAAVAEVDPPPSAGMALSATLDRKHLERPGRVWLQIGLRGSRRYGWRRPPLDVAVVLTASARATPEQLERSQDVVQELVRRLGAQDRVEVRTAADGGGTVVQEAVAATDLRHRTVALLDRIAGAAKGPSHRADGALAGTLAAAGASLVRLSDNPHRVPGTRLILVVAGEGPRATTAERAAHQLKLTGAVVSVLSVASRPDTSGWWRVANAGHGSFHRVADAGAKATVEAELATLSRVVARLLRLNINLGRDSHGVRILGSRMLGQREVKAVKAREERVDQALSKSMGVQADRGDDDDGLQTVIPYFFGDDSHVLLVELWVERPGAVADITLRYKDLVNLDNATARVSVALGAAPRPPSPAQREVRRNVRAMRLALSLEDAWRATSHGDNMAAMPALQAAERAARSDQDQRMVKGLQRLILDNRVAPAKRQRAVRDALRMARDRKVGYAGQ